MQITYRQKQLLDSLTCERLSSNEAHLRMIDSFSNGRNGSLEHTLKNEAYGEDENGNIAFYQFITALKRCFNTVSTLL